MSEDKSRLPKQSPERSQTPLYVAIVGLIISLYSFTMAAETMWTVALFGGVAVSVVAIAYWLINPKHGLDYQKASDHSQSALKSAGVLFVDENGEGPGARLRKADAIRAGRPDEAVAERFGQQNSGGRS